jgi:transposase, IS5 family
MSKQMTLGTGFERYSKTTRREKFLAEMDRIVPWGDLCTLIAPVYPKARDGKDRRRDPEMRQTKKGNQWYFGMKAHIGVDSQTKIVHSVVATPANVHDSVCLPELLHGEEARVWGDSVYQGQREVIRKHAPKATDFTNRRYRYKSGIDELQRAKNKTKSSVRAKYPLLIIKRIFGFVKTRYKGLAKNTHQLFVTCALTNLYLMRRRLWRLSGA